MKPIFRNVFITVIISVAICSSKEVYETILYGYKSAIGHLANNLVVGNSFINR